MKKIIFVLLVVIFQPITAQSGEQEVVDIAVTGLACPFCAYSLEKNLKKLPEVESAEVNLADNSAQVVIKADQSANVENIKQAIVKAGFTPGKATTSVMQE